MRVNPFMSAGMDVCLPVSSYRPDGQSALPTIWVCAVVVGCILATSTVSHAHGPSTPHGIAGSAFLAQGDHNGNGVVTLIDFSAWPGCMLGPIPNSIVAGCESFDFDADGDVDAIDLRAMQLALVDCDELRAPLPHNCCETGHGAGCTDRAIQACVCEQDAACCGTGEWDGTCVAEVDLLGCGTCVIENDCNSDGIPDVCGACVSDVNCDRDLDGAGDVCDNCPSLANADQADSNGNGIGDACEIGLCTADEDCDDGFFCTGTEACNPSDVFADANGCVSSGNPCSIKTQTCDDTNDVCLGEPPPPGCGNGIVETGEACDDAGFSATCNANCTASVCGDNNLNTAAGEECDDGNTNPTDGCSATCLIEAAPGNDNCSAPFTVTDGETSFVNIAATTDGPEVPVSCSAFGEIQIGSDVWFVYTATCDGELLVSLCGSSYDTKLAVYAGGACPITLVPDACSDDDCGVGALDSRVTLQVLAGDEFLIRAGGFAGEQGDGTLTIRCGVDTCATGSGACFTATFSPGCEDAECCRTTCEVDAFCCDVEWDEFCAGEAQGLCTGSFEACTANAGTCAEGNTTGGCDSFDCCNTVCLLDPFCCVDTWDSLCADQAAASCGLTCGIGRGSCFKENGSSGCENQSCCLTICADDPFCCQTEWDMDCASAAAAGCR